MKRVLRIAAFLGLSILCLFVFMAVRAIPRKTAPGAAQPAPPPFDIDAGHAAERLAGAIRIATVSEEGQPPNLPVIRQFADYLEANFPKVHAKMQREVLPGGALLYTWLGTDASKPPIVLMAHMDVVPAAAETISAWTHAPFSGDIAEGSVWGRGAIDDKGQLMALMEACESLLASGFTPARTLLLAFGDDEENRGTYGAKEIVALLSSRGVHPDAVLDEGGFVIAHAIDGLNARRAIVGIAEKGYLDVTLKTEAEAGHSSTPPRHTAIGSLSAALVKLERKPFPASMPEATRLQYQTLAPYLPFSQRLVLNNLWLTRPLLMATAMKNKDLAPSFHTTTAETIVRGGSKPNVLPSEAHATVNFRILPGETVESTVEGVRHRIHDAGVKVEYDSTTAQNPSPSSPIDTASFRAISQVAGEVFPDAIPTPIILAAATDSTHFTSLCHNVYRFAPLALDISELSMFHGVNEHIPIANFVRAVEYNGRLIKVLTQ
jgi:carboxypeptidase PM20D1